MRMNSLIFLHSGGHLASFYLYDLFERLSCLRQPGLPRYADHRANNLELVIFLSYEIPQRPPKTW